MAGSHQEIFDNAQTKISELQAVELQINRNINTIKDKEFDGPLTPTDRNRLVDLRSAKSSVLSAIEELAFVTMKALDTTDELKRINNALVGTVKDLKSTVERIAKIGKIADAIKQVLGGVQTISKQVEKLKAEDDKKK